MQKPTVPEQNLDPDLFAFIEGQNPKLHPHPRTHILSGVARISSVVPTQYAVIYGDSLSNNSKTSKVNVLVGLREKDMNKINSMTLNMVLKSLNDKYILGTRHPANFIITTEELNRRDFSQLFAPIDQKWLKYIVTEESIEDLVSIKKNYFGKNKQEDNIDDLKVAKGPFVAAKKANYGIWNISIGQADELVKHFHSNIPNKKEFFKMLGNTGIMLFRPEKDKFHLIKGSSLHKKAKKSILKYKLRKEI